MAEATLYGIPGSHAVRGGMLMLERKRIPYRLVIFKPGLHASGIERRPCGLLAERMLPEPESAAG